MIENVILGTKHPEVTHVKFGTGDIMFTKLKMEDGSHGLAFNQDTPHKIGEETNDLAGKNVDDFPSEIKVLFTFDKPESIAALIHSLIEIQKELFSK